MTTKIVQSRLGSVLLVSGCCVGAGMLGLPLVSLPTGFFVSILPLVLGWGYMYLSGLMLLEVYAGVRENINLTGLLDAILGKYFRYFGACMFLFLFYSLLTAYLNGSSIIINDIINRFFDVNISKNVATLLNSGALFLIILMNTNKIDRFNRVLVFLMLGFYFCLVLFGFSQISASNLISTSFNIKIITFAFPVFIVSFGFQNLIPTISHYLKYNIKLIKSALFRGTILALLIYLIWNFVVLGMIARENFSLLESSSSFVTELFSGFDLPMHTCINNFSLLAILTSLITIALSFVNFVSNSSENPKHRPFFAMVVIVPPTIFSLINPNVFLTALHIAGGICAVSLFGILPILMVWKTRYITVSKFSKIFPLGKRSLIGFFILSLFIIVLEIWNIIF